MLSLLLAVMAATLLPTFSIEKTCLMDTAAAQEDRGAIDTCVRDESAAMSKISKEWARYPTTERRECASGQNRDFDGSYVELMTCLEIQDWKRHLSDVGGNFAAGSRTSGGSPLTPSQIGGYSASHPLGGIPAAREH
jgi:hypothetical protein